LDVKAMASQLEDADLFEVVSDINRTDSTLKATLETSGKVMNMSLLDFLR
jgi:flagellar hook-associated protein 3 FlgL